MVHARSTTILQPAASHPHLVTEAIQGEEAPPPCLLLHPNTPSDYYCCEVTVEEGGGAVHVRQGQCRINGEPVSPGGRRRNMGNGVSELLCCLAGAPPALSSLEIVP